MCIFTWNVEKVKKKFRPKIFPWSFERTFKNFLQNWIDRKILSFHNLCCWSCKLSNVKQKWTFYTSSWWRNPPFQFYLSFSKIGSRFLCWEELAKSSIYNNPPGTFERKPTPVVHGRSNQVSLPKTSILIVKFRLLAVQKHPKISLLETSFLTFFFNLSFIRIA